MCVCVSVCVCVCVSLSFYLSLSTGMMLVQVHQPNKVRDSTEVWTKLSVEFTHTSIKIEIIHTFVVVF